MVIHYEEVLYQVYAPSPLPSHLRLPLPLPIPLRFPSPLPLPLQDAAPRYLADLCVPAHSVHGRQ